MLALIPLTVLGTLSSCREIPLFLCIIQRRLVPHQPTEACQLRHNHVL